MIWSLDKSASDTERHTINVSDAMQLDEATQEALRMRWLSLDHIHDVFSSGNTDTKRRSHSW